MSFSTRLTQLFATRHPILAGGLQWLADPVYVAAASKAGSLGFLTAASYADTPSLQDAIRRCRDLSDGHFGVNISMLPKLVEGERTGEVVQTIIAEKVPFVETSGRNPQAFLPALHDAGCKIIHKVPTIRHAVKAQSVGVDAVSIVGAECGGHPGMEMVGSFVQNALAARSLHIPFAVGGGIGHGSQIAAALAMGADGVVIGTRFLVAEEIWAAQAYKNRLVAMTETDTTLVLQSLRNTCRVMANQTTRIVQDLERQGADLATLMPHITGKLGRLAYETGDVSQGLLSAGQAVAFIDQIAPLAQIVVELVAQAEQAMARLNSLSVP
ncbi:MAG: NAD(P)H-dependent flavin oxidoreductase [Magnetospirillum sp.]